MVFYSKISRNSIACIVNLMYSRFHFIIMGYAQILLHIINEFVGGKKLNN